MAVATAWTRVHLSACGTRPNIRHVSVFLTKWFFSSSHNQILYLSPSALHYQAAADFAKAHLPEALRQQLLTYEREKERDREKDKEKDEKKERVSLSYPSILEQQILTLDREMLDKLSANYNEAGVCLLSSAPAFKKCILWIMYPCMRLPTMALSV